MLGVPAAIAKHNPFVMVRTELRMQLHRLNLSVKKLRRVICVPAKKRVIRLIATDRIRIKKKKEAV
jgi:hypothetical protein